MREFKENMRRMCQSRLAPTRVQVERLLTDHDTLEAKCAWQAGMLERAKETISIASNCLTIRETEWLKDYAKGSGE